MTQLTLDAWLEALLLGSDRPLTETELHKLLADLETPPSTADIQTGLETLAERYQGSGLELKHVASGYRIQLRPEATARLQGLNDKRPLKYSRALLETLSLIAYRQPISRGEIEQVRGVAVSSQIIRTLIERAWIKVVGYRDTPGRPALFGTTREFLDYFGLQALSNLPALPDVAKPADRPEALELELHPQSSSVSH